MQDTLNREYQLLQDKYGDKNLDAITFGGCFKNPDICFVFMNPTGRNVASSKTWKGIKAPWLGTKNIWAMFNKLGIIDDSLYTKIRTIKANEWTYQFAEEVYGQVAEKSVYITNLAKCTQTDARALPDEVYEAYLKLFYKEMESVNPKVIILFGNQVSSIVLKQKISVSKVRRQKFLLRGKFDCYSVFYPVGNGSFNIDKAISDIMYIIDSQSKGML